jgi:hypothetical protein
MSTNRFEAPKEERAIPLNILVLCALGAVAWIGSFVLFYYSPSRLAPSPSTKMKGR